MAMLRSLMDAASSERWPILHFSDATGGELRSPVTGAIQCLTLHNAAAVLDHHEGRFLAPGYTCTQHHIGHLGPGDWWFPVPEALPHIATAVHRRHDRVVVTDQYGSSYSHRCDAVVRTAVPDARVRMV